MFARPPAARPQPCDLHQVLDKTLDMLELQLGDAQVELLRDYAEDLPLVIADPDLTQQVFLNLCLNAIQAMPEGGELHVATGVRRYRTRRSMVDVSFRDTGVGIPRELMEKIFDPFFTTRSMGTGLGLPISVQIVREVGRRDHRQEQPGGGAPRCASRSRCRPSRRAGRRSERDEDLGAGGRRRAADPQVAGQGARARAATRSSWRAPAPRGSRRSPRSGRRS